MLVYGLGRCRLRSCSLAEDSDAKPEDEVRDTGRKRDASVRADAKADDDKGDDSDEPDDSDDDSKDDDGDDGEVVPDARVRDAGTDARFAASDAATRDAGSSGDASAAVSGETGRMVGMTAAHNAVRAMVETTMSLPELTWSS